jgi:pyroglutamyl-peptidase
MLKVLVAGFGPFPGAPRNPSGDLALALGRMRRPGLAGVKIHAHVFPTIFAAVAKELPRLLAKYDPDAVLLFGLAGRSDRVRIETRAVNAASLIHPDAMRSAPSRKLYPKAPAELSSARGPPPDRDAAAAA